ncbi:MAG: hypothetical protein WA057_03340 [Candidatus Magasanikiibacteriota bacterium]
MKAPKPEFESQLPHEGNLDGLLDTLENRGIVDEEIAYDLQAGHVDKGVVQSFLGRLKDLGIKLPNQFLTLLKERPSFAVLLTVLEMLAVSPAMALAEDVEEKSFSEPAIFVSPEKLKNIQRDAPRGYLKSNLEKPQDLASIGKMLVEPATVMISLPTNDGITREIAKVVLGKKYEDGSVETTIDFTVPYQYASDFASSDPVDKEKMKDDLRQTVVALLEKLTPMIFGGSFYEEDFSGVAKTESQKVNLKRIEVTGFASPEDPFPYDFSHKDPRNEKLAKMRAENAANALTELLRDKGVDVQDIITHKGNGEVQFDDDEKNKLQELSEKVKIKLPKGIDNLGDAKLIELVHKYNRGELSDEEANVELAKMLGSKRKVEIKVTIENHRVELILPVPYILIAIGILMSIPWTRRQREDRRERRWRRAQRYMDLEMRKPLPYNPPPEPLVGSHDRYIPPPPAAINPNLPPPVRGQSGRRPHNNHP